MKKIASMIVCCSFLAVTTGCVYKSHVPPGQIKKQSAPGQMKKH